MYDRLYGWNPFCDRGLWRQTTAKTGRVDVIVSTKGRALNRSDVVAAGLDILSKYTPISGESLSTPRSEAVRSRRRGGMRIWVARNI